jgi:peptidoglycan/xylan/chitin deacetylase (PgdA/CDA1 family)
MKQRRIPVLAWHGYNVFGNTYETNDLIAFSQDLKAISAEGFAIVPLSDVARWVCGERSNFEALGKPVVALSCDDGTDYDWRDMAHPEHGMQKGFATRLREFESDGAHAHLTCFVIASPSARAQIARGAMQGQNALNDDWWGAANDSGYIDIESHGWDHNHPTVSPVIQREQRTDNFLSIDTFAECDAHVRASSNFITSRAQRRPQLFAYPWTQASDYMRREYMPRYAKALGTFAAFGGSNEYITQQSDRWYLPRFFFGPDWRSEDGLKRILRDSLT